MQTEKPSVDRARETGLALAVVLLLLFRLWRQDSLIVLAIGVLVLTTLWPAVFKLPARLWFGWAEFVGAVSSKVLLTIVFVLVLLPMAGIRKITGADPMKRGLWKKGQDTVFFKRNHGFSAGDLEKPY